MELGLDVGVIGSWSGAEHTQRQVQDPRGFESPNGWNNQLNEEVALAEDCAPQRL